MKRVCILLFFIVLVSNLLTAQSFTVATHQRIDENNGGFSGNLNIGDLFGRSITSIGDLDNDGVMDVAVGAPWDNEGGTQRGAVWILFLNADGTVKSHQKISDHNGNFNGTLDNWDTFGSSLSGLGDLNGDGTEDLVVGAGFDDDGINASGALWVLFLNTDGTVKSHQKISNIHGHFTGHLKEYDCFGCAVAAIGDINGDDIIDLIVGAPGTDILQSSSTITGSVWILFLNTNGTVKADQRIDENNGAFDGNLDIGDLFGKSVAGIGDVNDDGIRDVAVGSPWDSDSGIQRGAVWILFLNSDGTVQETQKLNDIHGNFSAQLDNWDVFGYSVSGLRDVNQDGVEDIVAGAGFDDDGVNAAGAIYVIFLNADGTANSHEKISATSGNFTGNLVENDCFGCAVTSPGDLNGDGGIDLIVGTPGKDILQSSSTVTGSIWTLILDSSVGVQNIFGDETSLSLFPNPTSGNFQISLEKFQADKNVKLKIFDISGKEIYTQDIFEAKSAIHFRGDVKGAFMIKVYSDNIEIATGKIVVH